MVQWISFLHGLPCCRNAKSKTANKNLHKLVKKAIFGGVPPNLKGIYYFNLSFCHNHLLTKPDVYANFEQNR